MAAPIPKKVLDKLRKDPFMKSCCVCGKQPQWHHQMLYGGKAVNEAWAILPLCPQHHSEVGNKEMKQLMDWVALNRATTEQLDEYSRVMSYKNRRAWLNSVYGDFAAKEIPTHYANLNFTNQAGRRKPAVHN